MKIAQVAPLHEAVPPKLYGGTERVVHYLTEALIELGHQVTLFASGDSVTKANLISHVDTALRLNPSCVDPIAHHIAQLQDVVERADEFDIIHFHTDYIHFPISETISTPHVTTLHGRLDIPDLQYLYSKFPHQPVISISNDQRKPLPQANFVGTVYHGLPGQLLKPGKGEGGYLAFLGRISPEKGLPQAIEVAKKAGLPLKIAAKIDKADRDYYEAEVKHLLDHPLIEYIGEINEAQKTEFLGNALALMFTINWCEPFGMVMIESMACGTPVIAYPCGSVPEVIDNGKSGFIVHSVDEAVEAVRNIQQTDRALVRSTFEERFLAERMALDYVALFEKLVQQKKDQAALRILNPQVLPVIPPEKITKEVG